MDSHGVVFGSFRLDFHDERLWREDEAVRLTNKAFSVLQYLVQHPAQLVTKDALIEAVWSRSYVSDAALAMCIRELRSALGDSAQSPRFIATVRGRGYRFIAPIHDLDPPPLAARKHGERPIAARAPQAFLEVNAVGRDAELGQLHNWLDNVVESRRRTGFISGEAGIGKSTLVDMFVSQVEVETEVLIGRGQCIDQHGAGEPYLPLLEALGRLCRGTDGDRVLSLLRRHAPSWLVQMPSLVTSDESEQIQRALGGATRDRMLRELAEAVEVLTAERPLLLVLEDLHWSDSSTLEWLVYVTRLRDPAQLLVVGTYRPVDAIVRKHALRRTVQELKQQNQCEEVVLDYLTEEDVHAYLSRRAEGRSTPGELAHIVHRRSSGNPLFMVALVDSLLGQGALRLDTAGWQLEADLQTLMATVPESLRRLIEQQLDQFDPELRKLIDAASVAGPQFSASAVAAAVDQNDEEVDTRLAAMASGGQFVVPLGSTDWPDRTVAGQYGFIHTLYQEVIYSQLAAGRRARLHLLVGLRLELGHGEKAREVAVELATHFSQGRDPERAVQYLIYSGENALHRSAHQEAIEHFSGGLETLETLPVTDEHQKLELVLQSNLSSALIAAKGYAWPETAKAFARARELCGRLGTTEQTPAVLHGVCLFHMDRGELYTAREVADELLQTAEHSRNETGLLLGHRLIGTCFYFLGRLVSAREHLQLAIGFFKPARHASLRYSHAVDVRVAIKCWLSRTLVLMGYLDQAQAISEEAVDLAQQLSHPHSLAFALRDACFIPQFLDDPVTVKKRSEELIQLATDQGYTFELGEARIHHGWALAMTGHVQDGIDEIQTGLAVYRSTGSEFQLPHFLALAATVEHSAGNSRQALSLLDDALDRIDRTGECWYEAEVRRLHGEILLSRGKDQLSSAERFFNQALDVARRQQAKSLELLAATSLARVWRDTERDKQGRESLTAVCDWFTEGLETTPLRNARAMLQNS